MAGSPLRWATMAALLSGSAGCDRVDLPFLPERPAFAEAAEAAAAPDAAGAEVLLEDAGVWDGQYSLGGVWVARADIEAPAQVEIANLGNGRTVRGALFRRAAAAEGPPIQVSSDAAEALGMTAGEVARLRVTAPSPDPRSRTASRRHPMILANLARGFMLLILLALPAHASFETRAQAAYVLDLTTDTVLLSKNADVPLPPASMSKLMTLYMLFEALRDGRVTMETRFGVSDRAAAMKGSTMFLDQRDRPTVEELIQGIIVQSGNDACVVVAEGLAGTEDAFARLMNDRAAALGLEASTFTNASGWPSPDHRMSVHDLGRLAARLITEFPEYYGYFAQKEFEFDGRAPQNRFNRNPLLELGIGADGLKTGHTQEAGYGLVGSAMQGDRRIVFVMIGLDRGSAGAGIRARRQLGLPPVRRARGGHRGDGLRRGAGLDGRPQPRVAGRPRGPDAAAAGDPARRA